MTVDLGWPFRSSTSPVSMISLAIATAGVPEAGDVVHDPDPDPAPGASTVHGEAPIVHEGAGDVQDRVVDVLRALEREEAPPAPAAPEDQVARPFFKAVGGKAALLDELAAVLPPTYRRYYEPFAGGAALFYRLAAQRPPDPAFRPWATLVDNNPRLIRCYRGVRDAVENVIAYLTSWPTDRETYDRIRAMPIDGEPDALVAAWFLYLNRNGYNGVYRVNRQGVFNVPYGKYKDAARRPNVALLRAASAVLRGIVIEHGDFEEAARWAGRDDLVYFDPPYLGTYASYTQEKFDRADHERLRIVADRARARGAHVIVSNSAAAAEIWQDGWTVRAVAGRQSVSRGQRGKQEEILVTP